VIRFLVRGLWSLLVLGVLVYATFFVPLGQRTLYQHVTRIAGTDEARDLGREVGEATHRAGEAIAQQVRGEQAEGMPGEGRAPTP